MCDDYKILMNFFKDWTEILKQRLIKRGYKINSSKPYDICMNYFNLEKRLINKVSREIVKAKSFNCPSRYKNSLSKIKSIIESGNDLTPYLSKKVEDLEYNDAMLNDWGIYHLHLGTYKNSSGFVNRTGPLLFARFDNKKAYFIGIFNHNSWTKQKLVEIIHNNWPKSIEKFRLKGINSLTKSLSDKNIKEFRNAGLSTMFEAEPGAVYAPIGGGYMSDGSSTEVVMTCDGYARRCKEYEKKVRDNINKVISAAKKNKKEIKDEFNFVLEIDGNKAYAIEVNMDIALLLEEN